MSRIALASLLVVLLIACVPDECNCPQPESDSVMIVGSDTVMVVGSDSVMVIGADSTSARRDSVMVIGSDSAIMDMCGITMRATSATQDTTWVVARCGRRSP